jgi:Fe-S-cluster containining protein
MGDKPQGGMIDKLDELAFLVLEGLYDSYEQMSRTRTGLACQAGCAACCTDRVRLTTLEARYLARGLVEALEDEALEAAAKREVNQDARPLTTFNALARMCINHEEPPADPDHPDTPGVCPLLRGHMCIAYEHRPLACRTIASSVRCVPGGEAVDEPWWLTLNAAFFQIMEQADFEGGFGVLPEVLQQVLYGEGENLLVCEAMPGLPAPQEHQKQLGQAMERLFGSLYKGKPLGLWYGELCAKKGIKQA